MDIEDILSIIRVGIITIVLFIVLVIYIVTDSKPQNNQYDYCPYCGAKITEVGTE